MTESHPELPPDVQSRLIRLLDEPENAFALGVDALCAEQPTLANAIRAEAASLLRAGRDRTAASPDPADPGPEVIPTHIGPFRILAEIGRGGMGTVYLAERGDLKQRVALKVIKLGMDTKAVLARFDAERAALSRMEHAHIARVLDAGATDRGQPWFAMEYVKGEPITRYCDKHRVSIEERLRLFQQVCSGVQHAHTKGVVHRDLTPNNILVTVQEGKATAKIIDFGLAKATDRQLTDKTIFTEQGLILGTPEYMAPEQAGIGALDVDTRADVYTLGVLLYELLVGALPFSRDELRAAGWDGMCKTIQDKDPPRPSTKITEQAATRAIVDARRTDASALLRRLRGDLDWVVMKCLEKDRTRRYETPIELAADVQRHLDFEPLLAHAPSFGYRLRKFARRYRGQLASASVVVVAVLAGLAGSTTFWLEAKEQATEAERQKRIAQEQTQAAETARAGEAAKAREASENAATARRNADDAIGRKKEFDQLAGVVLYERAIEAERNLYPAWPSHIPAMEQWLKDAHELLTMRPKIEQTVNDLRAQALVSVRAIEPNEIERRNTKPRKQPTVETRIYQFEDESRSFLLDTLQNLLGKLASLDGKERKAVDERLGWARRIAALTAAHPKARATWQQAREAIAKADGVVASELYRGQPIELRDQDVIGLVPIGMNPASKLWEFYDLRSAWDPAWAGLRDPASLEIPRHVAKGLDAGYIEVGDDIGIVFVLLPGGKLKLGTQADDPDAPSYDPQRENDEALYEVTLSPFFLARHELTQGQWRRLSRGEVPSRFGAGTTTADVPTTWSNPVEQVDWEMSVGLLGRHGMLLPTEAQWEYGCRAGTATPWGCALEDLVRYANVADATAKRAMPSWTCDEWSDGYVVHAPVGSFLPSAFGLFDVHGNVWEWTRDGEDGASAIPRNGDGLRGDPGSSSYRAIRGGSFYDTAREARSGLRIGFAPTTRAAYLGLRPARAFQP